MQGYGADRSHSNHLVRVEVPLADKLTDQLIQTWSAIFGSPFEGLRQVLSGAETSQNSDILYLAWEEGLAVPGKRARARKQKEIQMLSALYSP